VTSTGEQGFELATGTPGVLGVTGALNFSNAAAAMRAIESALSNASIRQLDLAGVAHTDSAGLSCLVAVMAAAARQSRSLTIVNMPAGLQALAKVSEVDQLINRA
jgi:phospholipid transport system transporter-binding protein